MTEPTGPLPGVDADQHSVLAEEVRAYLVSVRGGAPFLSSADGRLLVGWIDQGVPIAAVLSAIERTARRRAGRRMRTRLTLRACKGEVKKLVGGPSPAALPPRTGAPTPRPPHRAPLADEADRIAAASVPASLEPARGALVRRLRDLATRPELGPDRAASRAAAAIRRFHEDVWDATADQHAALTEQARATLAALEPVVSARVFTDLVDEQVRQSVRALVPDVELEPLWAHLTGGPPP